MTDPLDLRQLDLRIARGQPRVESELARLRVVHPESGSAAAEAGSPSVADLKAFAQDFGGIRDVAGQATFRELEELVPGFEQGDTRAGMQRWVLELLQLRVAWDLVVDDGDAMRAVDPAIVEHERSSPRSAATVPDAVRVGPSRSYADALEALVEATHLASAEAAFRRLGELAAPVAAIRKELRARRFEVAARLGLAHPWQLAATGGADKLAELARSVLDATEPLATELHKHPRRDGSGSGASAPRNGENLAARTIFDAFARDAGEGWPARLGPRWFAESFRAVAPRSPKMARVPESLGAASFVRGAAAWGALLRLAGTARSLPFVLARDPYPTEAHVLGGVFAIALGDPTFARRKLGLSKRAVDAHVRALGRVLFVSLRTTAAGLLAGMKASPDADAIEELGARVFGSPLPRALGAAWSYGSFSGALPIDLPARLLGATRAPGFAASLVARFDDDWFDNPRAGTHLQGVGTGPVWAGDIPDASAVTAIARAFEEKLG